MINVNHPGVINVNQFLTHYYLLSGCQEYFRVNRRNYIKIYFKIVLYILRRIVNCDSESVDLTV